MHTKIVVPIIYSNCISLMFCSYYELTIFFATDDWRLRPRPSAFLPRYKVQRKSQRRIHSRGVPPSTHQSSFAKVNCSLYYLAFWKLHFSFTCFLIDRHEITISSTYLVNNFTFQGPHRHTASRDRTTYSRSVSLNFRSFFILHSNFPFHNFTDFSVAPIF